MAIIFTIMLIWMISSGFIYILAHMRYRFSSSISSKKDDKLFILFRTTSGWLIFISWIGIWISPQQKIHIYIPGYLVYRFYSLKILLPSFITGTLFLTIGMILGILGLKELSFRVSSHEMPSSIVTSGIYSKIRHPQYLGGILSHIGISLILLNYYSLISTPLIFLLLYLMAVAEEKYLIEKFGKQYREYMLKTPRFLPKIRIKLFYNKPKR